MRLAIALVSTHFLLFFPFRAYAPVTPTVKSSWSIQNNSDNYGFYRLAVVLPNDRVSPKWVVWIAPHTTRTLDFITVLPSRYLAIEAEVRKCGDINGDGHVDQADLIILRAFWLQAAPLADFNADGIVDQKDMDLLVANWGT